MDFNSTGAMRSPFSPRVRQSMSGRRPIGSAKKHSSKYNQSAEDVSGDVIYKTPMLSLETYGAPLPVMVTEALTFGSGDVSVSLSECGWCWAVAGRRVLAWPDAPSAAGPPSARDLTLPQTDLAHKADLVMLFYEEGAQMPSCIGVSPEGIVRYWPSVGQEGTYVDVSCELAGQECDRVTCTGAAAPLVLATTTCTLVLLTPSTVDSRPTVNCKTLRPPSGWLGGIGRRVSLMFFGSMPAHVDTKLVGVVVLPAEESDDATDADASPCLALVASGGSAGPVLQAWRGAELHEHALRGALLAALPRAPDAAPAPDLTPLQLRAAPQTARALLLLFTTHQARHYLAQISLQSLAAPAVTRLVPLRAPEESRFLPLPAHVLLYSRDLLVLQDACGASRELLDVGGSELLAGRALGAGGGALLFSRRHGLLRLRTSAARAAAAPAAPSTPEDVYDSNLSLYEIDPNEISSATLDLTGKLKTAFLFHVRRDSASCLSLLGALLASRGGPAHAPVDDALDTTALTIATDMLDDMPQGDPRWQGGGGGGALALGRSCALQLGAQLQDKRRAFALYLDFLQARGLEQRLQAVTYEGCVMDSRAVLCWLAAQLAAAAALRARASASDADAALVDAAVQAVVCSDAGLALEEPEVADALACGALSASDVCFRRVSRIHRVLLALAGAAVPAGGRARLLALLAAVLGAMGSARLAWGPPARCPPPPARALLVPLVDLVETSVGLCVTPGGTEAGARAAVLENAAALADAALELAAGLEGAGGEGAALLAALRRRAVLPFVRARQLDRAAALAERHHDLQLLAEMCVQEGDIPRLLSAARTHSQAGFVELACAALAAAGGERVRVLLGALADAHPEPVRAWLLAAPAAAPLRALHLLGGGERAPAAAELLREAERGQGVARTRTAASLAKLCLAAEEDDREEEELLARAEDTLTLCAAHGALPRALRTRHAIDDDCRVHEPEQLVQMYIDDDGSSLSEYDYQAALELTALVTDRALAEDLRLRVWCACVRRDDWAAVDVGDPRAEVSRRTVFQVLDALHVAGRDALLPDAAALLAAPALSAVLARPAARYLLQYGLQCMREEEIMA